MQMRAKNKDGIMPTGNLFRTRDGKYYLMSPSVTLEVLASNPEMAFVEVDPSTLAFKTGKKDKHGNDIYGSKGEFGGGDRIRGCTTKKVRAVFWSDLQLAWCIRTSTSIGDVVAALSECDTTGHEIINEEGGA